MTVSEAAAERLDAHRRARAARKPATSPYFIKGYGASGFDSFQHDRDFEAVLADYLAALPELRRLREESDATPATLEWIEETFPWVLVQRIEDHLYIYDFGGNLMVRWFARTDHCKESIAMYVCEKTISHPTRGQVLTAIRLLALDGRGTT